jgi:putative transposase
VARRCRRYAVTPSGFYPWRQRRDSAHAHRDRELTAEIARRFAVHQQRYGRPRIHRALVNAGWSCSRRHVARLMRAAGLRAKAVQCYRANPGLRARFAQHPYRLWTTRVTRPDHVWVGDITCLRVASGWRYLAIVMDQYSRRILAWTLTRRRTTRETCHVLALARERRRRRGPLIFHSDRGSECMGSPFCTFVARHGLQQSANVKGPGDNAHAESFFHSLTAELTRGTTFLTEHALHKALDTYLRYYNTHRWHSALGYQ